MYMQITHLHGDLRQVLQIPSRVPLRKWAMNNGGESQKKKKKRLTFLILLSDNNYIIPTPCVNIETLVSSMPSLRSG